MGNDLYKKTVPEFCKEAEVSRPWLDSLPKDQWPRYVRLKNKLWIIEPVGDWLNRMSAQQAA